jgi:hypothetical protein
MTGCDDCRGACCEELEVHWWDLLMPWVWSWLRARGLSPLGLVRVGYLGRRLAIRCRRLGLDGRCEVYQDRPLVCRAYQEGSPACEEVRKRRRPHNTP